MAAELNETESVAEIMLDPKDYNPDNVVIKDPSTISFKIGANEITMTSSDARYLNEAGEECKMYFSAPQQTCFGPQYQYDMNVPDDEKNPDKAKGMQVQYPITSMQSINAPTEAEQAFSDMMQSLWELSLAKAQEELLREEQLIPEVSYNSFVAAERKGVWTNALKPWAEHPNVQGGNAKKKTLDTTKPKRMYVKLKTSGQGKKLRVHTPFYGPGDVQQSPIKYIGARGILTPCMSWEGIYWGMHGTAPHGASLRFHVVEANFVPVSSTGGLPSRRMLPANTAEPSADDDADASDADPDAESDAGEEEGTFDETGGPAQLRQLPSSAMTALNKAAAQNKGKVKLVTPTKVAGKPKAKIPGKAPTTPGKVAGKAKAKVTPGKAPAKVAGKTPAKVAGKAKAKKVVPEPVEDEEVEDPLAEDEGDDTGDLEEDGEEQ